MKKREAAATTLRHHKFTLQKGFNMSFSYSLHLSNKGNAITSTSKLAGVSRHNLRQYKSANYDKDLIEILRGSPESILNDVREKYQEEFTAALVKYNEGKRADRQIFDYLKHVSDKKQTDVACEIILQIGDQEFWSDKTQEERREMSEIIKLQLSDLEELVPDFKICSAVIHYDEKSPHAHIVGVPVHEGYKKGLEKQVSKTKVFTPESLEMLQEKMRERVKEHMKGRELFKGMELKEKEKGRNKDIPKKYLGEFYQKEAEAKEQLQSTKSELDNQRAELWQNEYKLEQLHNNIEYQLQEQDTLERNLQSVCEEIGSTKEQLEGITQELDEAKKTIAPQVHAFKVIAQGVQDHKKPNIEIDKELVRDNLFSSHEQVFVKIPANDEREAKKTLEEINALYNKQFTDNSLNELIMQNDKRMAKKREKLRSDIKQFEQDKQEFEQYKQESMQDLDLYKQLGQYELDEDVMRQIMQSGIAWGIIHDTIDTTLQFVRDQGINVPVAIDAKLHMNQDRIFEKVLRRMQDLMHKAKVYIVEKFAEMSRPKVRDQEQDFER